MNIETNQFIVLLVGLFIGAASVPGVILTIAIIIIIQKQRSTTTKNNTHEPQYEEININYNNTPVLVHPNDAYNKFNS